MRNLVKLLSLSITFLLTSFNAFDLAQSPFSLCEVQFQINSLTLDLCSNSGKFLTEEQIASGLGSAFENTLRRIDETSFEDTGGKKIIYRFSESENNSEKAFAFSIFVYPNNNYYYSFSIQNNDISFSYNSGLQIKIGDPLGKVSNEFQSNGFRYNSATKSATINIIDEGYLTFYFDDNDKLKSIGYYNQLI